MTAMDSSVRPGLILLAHGSRDALWRTPIEAVQALLQQRPGPLLCCCAYLEACAPDLPAAAQSLLDQGATQLAVLPLFLGTGKHARQDIPILVQALRQAHPGLSVRLHAPVGEDMRLTQLLATLGQEAAWAPQE